MSLSTTRSRMVSLELLIRILPPSVSMDHSQFCQKQAILAQKQPKNVNFGSFYAFFGPFQVFFYLRL